MKRLTKRIINSCGNPTIKKYSTDYLISKRLAEFEDFMESEGFQDLNHLAFTIEEQKKINEAYEKENKTFKFMWQRLKEFIMDELNEDNHNYEMTGIGMYDHYSLADQTILDKMLKLEENNSICSMK